MQTIIRASGPRRGMRNRSLASLVAIVVAACWSGTPGAATGAPILVSGRVEVVLELPPERSDGVIDSLHDIQIRLVNRSEDTIRLVLPGDGSDVGWRTPRVGWSVLPADSDESRPREPAMGLTPRCGNLNPIQVSEVVELEPGGSVVVESWFGRPMLARGSHRVAFYYRNDPALGASGLAPRTPEVDELLLQSTSCEAWSEELIVRRR